MKSIQHIGINCSDFERSSRFYSDILGLPLQKEVEVPAEEMREFFEIDSRAKVRSFKVGDQIIELFFMLDGHDMKSNSPSNLGISHFAIFVGDREKYSECLKSKGVPVICKTRADKNMVYFAKDPDGVLIELRE